MNKETQLLNKRIMEKTYDVEFWRELTESNDRDLQDVSDWRFMYNASHFLQSVYNVKNTTATAIASSLFHRMSDGSLKFHSPIHIVSTLEFAEDNGIYITNAEKLAFWFHDAICDVEGDSWYNEEASRDFMVANLSISPKNINYNRDFQNDLYHASSLIKETSNHLHTEVIHNEIMDLDLLNLSWSEVFPYITKAIRFEYPNLSDEDFTKGRKEFLRKLIKKGFIYRTDQFKKFEDSAMKNIKDYMES